MPLYIDSSHTRTVDDLNTIPDLDEAIVLLTDTISTITNRSDPLTPGAKKALRFRRLALQRCEERRAAIRRSLTTC